MDIRHTPTHSPLTLRVSGVTENSAFPTRLRLSPTLSLRADSLTLTSPCPTLSPTPSLSLSPTPSLSLSPTRCLTLPHIATPSRRRIGDALFFRNPIRTERSGGRMGLLSPHTLSALRRCATPPPARPRSADLIASRSSGGVRPRQRSRLQLTPDSVGGTRTDADAPRSAAADTLQHTPAHLFENSVHLSHSFRIESGSRLITASLHHRRHPHSSSRSDGTLP